MPKVRCERGQPRRGVGGGEYEKGFPNSQVGIRGISSVKFWKIVMPEKHF